LDLRVLAARDADVDDGPPRTGIDGIANFRSATTTRVRE